MNFIQIPIIITDIVKSMDLDWLGLNPNSYFLVLSRGVLLESTALSSSVTWVPCYSWIPCYNVPVILPCLRDFWNVKETSICKSLSLEPDVLGSQ